MSLAGWVAVVSIGFVILLNVAVIARVVWCMWRARQAGHARPKYVVRGFQ